MQRITAKEGIGWDELVSEATRTKVFDIAQRLKSGDDPVKGSWLVPTNGTTVVWTDASNIALGVALSVDGHVIEDAAWLRKPNDTAHINISELDAAIRGINMASKWKFSKFTIRTDSVTVYGWLRSVFCNTHNVKTRALSELLIRRRLDILRELNQQEELKVSVELVKSEHNLADKLTRVPKLWLSDNITTALIATVDDESTLATTVLDIHRRHHLGIDRTWELVKLKLGPEVKRADVADILAHCDECAKICPATNTNYPKGHLSCDQVWRKVSTDVTHFGRQAYLTIIDLGSRYCVWRMLRTESAEEICFQLHQLFAELGPPQTMLSDNAPVYRSAKMKSLMDRWDIVQEFSCAYRPQGNGISERNHRTIKTMAARSANSIEECVFWYNTTSGVKQIPPYNIMFHSCSRLPGVLKDRTLVCKDTPDLMKESPELDEHRHPHRNPFVPGDSVYLRTDGRCDSEWSGPHRVTRIISDVSLEVNSDDIPRHISHVKRVPQKLENNIHGEDSNSSESEDESILIPVDFPNTPSRLDGDITPVTVTPPLSPRRSPRVRRRPTYLNDYST